MIITAGLLLDFGNSETRAVVLAGKKAYRFNLSNRFANLPTGYKVPRRYMDDKSTIFIYKRSVFASGLIVEREFVGNQIRPSALQSKTEQVVTDLTLNLAIIKAMRILAEANATSITNLDVTFNVSVLLPPLDHEVHEEAMIEKIRNLEKVQPLNPNPNGALTYRIGDNVNVYSEAVSAFFGALFQEEGARELEGSKGKSLENGDVIVKDNGESIQLTEVEQNKRFATGYSLVLDIGAGTTDVAIFKDSELVEKSKETFNQGGNMVSSIVLNGIKKKFGFTPYDLQRVIATGILDEGDYKHDVSDIVTEAKFEYARQTRADLMEYLERISLDLRVVKGLLVSGGGSLPSIRKVASIEEQVQEDGTTKQVLGAEVTEEQIANGAEYQEAVVSPPMAGILVDFLKEIAPRIEAVHVESKDLRDLNIKGLVYLHKYMG